MSTSAATGGDMPRKRGLSSGTGIMRKARSLRQDFAANKPSPCVPGTRKPYASSACSDFKCMQVCTYMKETEQRILDAAMRVFGRDGVSGATTREIARVARVNEVTLFRYFRNKNELLRQMVLCSAKQYDLVFADASVKS